jgi:hypothetical protein
MAYSTNKSHFKAPFKNVKVQLTILIVAGSDIITVTVLYNALLLWSKPTKYIWWPHTKKPIKPIMYIAHTKWFFDAIRRILNLEITILIIPKVGIISMYTSGCPKNQNKC